MTLKPFIDRRYRKGMDMLALSTSFISLPDWNVERFLANLSGFNLAGIELDYRISQKQYAELFPLLKTCGLKVVSIHNFFPHPTVYAHLLPSGDLFHLCHLDPEHRQKAIQWTEKTLEHAHELEAEYVILHCGHIHFEAELDVIIRFFQKNQIHSDQAQAFILKKTNTREQLQRKHLDALLFSLDRLVRTADKYHLKIGLENRRHYHEMPNLSELKQIFAEFDGSPVSYWHNTGYAFINERLTIADSDDLILTFSKQLAGLHLQDAKQLVDHLVPGSGEIDFKKVLSFIDPAIPCVLELKPGTKASDIEKGIEILHETGFPA